MANYRINSDVMFTIIDSNEYVDFGKFIENPDTFEIQYIQFDTVNIDKSIWSYNIDLSEDFNNIEGKINKVFDSERLVDIGDLTDVSLRHKAINMQLKQNFNWQNIFGILIVIKGATSKSIYCSRYFNVQDFEVSNQQLLIDNSFWTASTWFNIPKLNINIENENLLVYCDYIGYDDIIPTGPDIGLITTYPSTLVAFEPLIEEAVLPPTIDINIGLEDNQYIHIAPVTTITNKTVKQVLLEYFDLTENRVNITIRHYIKYGNLDEELTGTGYKSLVVQNYDDPFGAISFGIDFRNYIEDENPTKRVLVFVNTEFEVNNTVMRRQKQLVYDFGDVLNPIIEDVIKGAVGDDVFVFPVTVNEETIIEQQVIETKESHRILKIMQPVFVELITSDVKYENKLISFSNIISDSYMELETGDIIISQVSSDGIYYFNLSLIPKPEADTTFNIIENTSGLIMRRGIFVE